MNHGSTLFRIAHQIASTIGEGDVQDHRLGTTFHAGPQQHKAMAFLADVAAAGLGAAVTEWL